MFNGWAITYRWDSTSTSVVTKRDTPLMTTLRLDKTQDYAKLLADYDTWLFDCDGVLWHGDRLVPGAKEVLSLLRAKSASPSSHQHS